MLITLKWKPWTLTISADLDEWEAWDEDDAWYVTVNRHGFWWHWQVAWAPTEDGDVPARLEYNSWALTKERAMRQSRAKALILWRERCGAHTR